MAKKQKRLDDYRRTNFYQNRSPKTKNGFARFSDGDTHYFAYFINGNVCMKSQGYTSIAGRDNGITSVTKNMKLAERYEYKEHAAGKTSFGLMAGNKQEIAISPRFANSKYAQAVTAFMRGERKSLPKAASKKPSGGNKAAKKKTLAPRASTLASGRDDYKSLSFYEKHATGNGEVERFKGDDGEHYFVFNRDGKINWISEGYTTEAARDNGVRSVDENLKLEERYKFSKHNGKHCARLHAANHQQIAKSIWYSGAAAATAGAAWWWGGRKTAAKVAAKVAAPVAAAAVASAAAAASPKPKAAAPVQAVAATAAGTSGGGLRWLLWLLPLLLIGALALFGLKNCKKEAVVTPAVKAKAAPVVATPKAKPAPISEPEPTPIVEPAPIPEPEPVQIVEPAPKPKTIMATPINITAGLNNCGSSDVGIFNVPTYSTPVSVALLGTYPEFGDSHGLTPAQFYEKLSRKYSESTNDAVYLDYLFRSMGYENGFADASADLFSEEVLPAGTTGLLGVGVQHHYGYNKLDTSERDRMAFRIQSNNGQVVHFMKTCGNYMYACQ